MRMVDKLIVHADDFGETVEITNGICAAIEAGAVTSTSIMANMPGTEDALPRVAALASRASFGVHLNLCEGRPLTAAGTLVGKGGSFHSKRELFLRAATGRLSGIELVAEVSAQVGRVHDAGVRISHLDGHKHLHQLPMVRDAVATVLARFGIERVRVTRLGHWPAPTSPATFVREMLARPAARTFGGVGLRSPDRVMDIRALMQADEAGALRLFGRAPNAVVELFCHPGSARADKEKPGSCRRYEELQYLLSPLYRERLAAAGARLATYWDI
jgi:predicted glycoside hydrolase/deacetylase ChbG (UPF0249 family)